MNKHSSHFEFKIFVFEISVLYRGMQKYDPALKIWDF